MINTIREWVESVLGTYEPVTFIHKAYDTEGALVGSWTEVASGVAGVDWGYIVTAALLIVCIWSVFRLLGVLLDKM